GAIWDKRARNTRIGRTRRKRDKSAQKQLGQAGQKYPNRPKRDKSAQKQLGQAGQKYPNRPKRDKSAQKTIGTSGLEIPEPAEPGRNCPKRSKIKIGRPGQKDPKYAKKPKEEPKANQKVPRVFGQMRDKEAHFGGSGVFCPKQHWDIRDEWTRSTRKDPAGPRNIEKLPRVLIGVKVK
ncbi:hypothetical protein KI387_013300, partial [Taxus chinensis]